jgi:hypothetical protein
MLSRVQCRRAAWAAAACIVLASAIVVAGELPAPRVEVVLQQEATLNGVPITIVALHSAAPPAAFAQAGHSGPVRVVRSRGPLRETLDVRDDGEGGSQLLWSRLDLRRVPQRVARPPVALPPGNRLLRTITVDDDEARASQFMVELAAAPPRAQRLLCEAARGAGWELPGSTDCESAVVERAQWMLRGGETLGISVTRAGRGSRAAIGHVAPHRGGQ